MQVKNYANTVPLVGVLKHPSMRPRHWDMVKTIVGKDFPLPDVTPGVVVGDMLAGREAGSAQRSPSPRSRAEEK